MCGIAGIIQKNTSPIALVSKATEMANEIIHRGPDSSGVWKAPNHPIAISHQRLAIQDLSPLGHQPMTSKASGNTLAFKGEIYNFRAIKVELIKAGKSFAGHSDTEVLLTAIETYGFDSTLNKIKGMFALAFWDEAAATLSLTRDRIGEKPLYYGIIDDCFVFASELKAIYKVFPPSKFLTINKQALNSFLRYGYISAPQTIFNELTKLPPGNTLTLDIQKWTFGKDNICNHFNINKYWSIGNLADVKPSYSDNDTTQAVNDLDKLLNSIIQEQSIADVPLGSFLSGGIDSSLVTAYLQSQSSKQIETFTIGFKEKEFNEAEHAKRIAKHLGTSHNELYLSAQDALDSIPDLIEINDEPFANASQIPTYLVSKFAKSKLTVCLSGDGGDELFCGYNRYTQGLKFNSLAQKLPSPVKKAISSTVNHAPIHLIEKLYALINQLTGKKGGANLGLKIRKAAEALNISDPSELYQFLCSYHQSPSKLIADTNDRTLPNPICFQDDYLKAAMAWDQEWYLPGDNLYKSDRASMAVSLEMRVPLLDRDLIELSWSLPNSIKYRDGKSKWILRQLLYKKVPQSLIDRPKMGFTVPISHWIKADLFEWSSKLLSKEMVEQQGIFNFLEIDKLFSDHLTGRMDNGNRLWTLLMFQSWYQKYYKFNLA